MTFQVTLIYLQISFQLKRKIDTIKGQGNLGGANANVAKHVYL